MGEMRHAYIIFVFGNLTCEIETAGRRILHLWLHNSYCLADVVEMVK
jgi:hypothetical protein